MGKLRFNIKLEDLLGDTGKPLTARRLKQVGEALVEAGMGDTPVVVTDAICEVTDEADVLWSPQGVYDMVRVVTPTEEDLRLYGNAEQAVNIIKELYAGVTVTTKRVIVLH